MKTEIVASRRDRKRLIATVRVETEEDAELFRKEFQKMIRKCNHLLKSRMGYELIIIQQDREMRKDGKEQDNGDIGSSQRKRKRTEKHVR